MISVIIPVYNTPIEFFRRCIDSIMQQSYSDFEVIVVDDGSKEEMHPLYDSLCSANDKIKLYRQGNKGVSAARNYGISVARGEYLTFVDADDTISPSFFKESILMAERYDADFVVGTIKYVPGKDIRQGSEQEIFVEKEKMADLKRALLQLPQGTFQYPVLGTPCARLYARRCMDHVCFPEGVTHWEDQIFNRRFLNQISSAVVSPHCWYFYYQNDFSAMHRDFDNRYISNSKPFWKLWHELNLEEDEDILTDVQKRSMDFFCTAVHLNILPLNIPWREKKKMMEDLWKEEIFQQIKISLDYKDVHGLKDKIRLYCLKENKMRILYELIRVKKQIKQ